MPTINPFTITYDDEDLTEIESSDDELEDPPPPPTPVNSAPPRAKSTRPSTQTATEKSRARGGLQSVAPALKPYRSTTFATSALNEWISMGYLDLDAEYQRGIVWNDQKQMGLIDSIFRNYYIPPIVFTCTQKDDGNEVRVCIDGKQRLTSIRRFILGEIPYKDVTTNRKLWFTSPPGARRKLISPAMQNTFKNKQITCSEYDSVTKEQEREIFQRVQMGMTLGPADRLPAINGPYADLVRGLRRKIESTEGFGAYHNWGEARGRDFQALTQIVYLMSHGTEPKKSEPTAMRLEAFLGQAGVDVSALERNANEVLDTFIRIAQHPVLSKPLQGELAPLEFVMAFYLIFTHRLALNNDAQLSAAIYHMRQKFCEVSPNRKVNTSVFKNMLNFVLVHVRKLKLNIPIDFSGREGTGTAGGIKSDQTKAKAEPAKSTIPIPRATKSTSTTTGKRKHVEDEDDSEDYIVPVKKKPAPQHKAETKPPAIASGSQALKVPPSRSRLESRLASKSSGTSSAKTTVKRTTSAQQKQATAPATNTIRKPSIASSISSSAFAQIVSPTIRSPYPPPRSMGSLPSSRRNSLAPEEMALGSSSSSGLPPSASHSHSRFPLPGRSSSVNHSPLVPAFSPQAQFASVSGQSNVVNAGNVAESAGSVPVAQDRGSSSSFSSKPATKTALKVAIPSGSTGPLADNNNNGESSRSVSALTPTTTTPVTTPATRYKYPKFTKNRTASTDLAHPPQALNPVAAEDARRYSEVFTTTNSRTAAGAPMVVGQAGMQVQQPPAPTTTSSKSLTQVLGVVQPPPTRDPRSRPGPAAVRQDQLPQPAPAGQGQLPTPPQSSISSASPQLSDQQLAGTSSMPSSSYRVVAANPFSRTAIADPLPQRRDGPQQPPLKRMRPCPPYPGSGNQS